MIEESSGNDLVFSFLDDNPDIWQLFDNDVLLDDGNWLDTQILTSSLDSLIAGLHNLTLYMYDDSGNVIITSIQY